MSTTIATQEKPRKRGEIFFTGMALFSMFFGAGNLIFPLKIGQTCGTEIIPALMGLTISAVAFPFLGLIAMMFFKGDLRQFLSRLGQRPAFWLLLLLQIVQGPLCISRLFALMHASVRAFFPSCSLLAFSLVIGALVFFLTYRPNKIIDLLGTALTPILLLSLGVLIFAGMIDAPAIPLAIEGGSFHFLQGLKGGYLTMDLISSLLFATMILPHLSKGERSEGEVHKKMLKTSLVAAGLLTLTYVGLCWLSVHHSQGFEGVVASEDMLQVIALKVLGPWGGFVSAVAVFLACLTTAISLASISSEYFCKDIFKNRTSPVLALAITLLATTAFANLGFGKIIQVLSLLLDLLYPALIVLCLLNIAHCKYSLKTVKIPVFATLGFSVLGLVFS